MSVPPRIAAMVEDYVNRAHDDADNYDNSTPLDESGVWSLHQLAATIYEAGFDDGVRVQAIRESGHRQRRSHAESRDKALSVVDETVGPVAKPDPPKESP